MAMATILEASYLVAFLYLVLSAAPVAAEDTEQLDRAVNAVIRSLPPGWTLAERKPREIPWGHHWGQSYTGPTGTLVIVKGTRPVNAEFSDANDKWRAVHVATEALEIWLMPSNYNNSVFGGVSIGRPIQPSTVLNHGPIKVYARPSHLLISAKDFNELLAKFQGVRWPDSPENNPKSLTWKDWRLELSKTIKKGFTK
jgi:hypothetical protein